MLLNEGVVCEGNSPPAYLGLPSLQDELTDRLQVGKSVRKTNEYFEDATTQSEAHINFYITTCEEHSPPGHIGLQHLHHGNRGLVNFDKAPAEDPPQPHHLDHLHHFRTDAFNPNSREPGMLT